MLIPSALEDAMSMQAQAEYERQARAILGDSECQIAEKFGEVAQIYADNPTAFHLQAMNLLDEGLKKENATIVIVPSTAVETMQLGGLAGVTALSAHLTQKAAPKPEAGITLHLNARIRIPKFRCLSPELNFITCAQFDNRHASAAPYLVNRNAHMHRI